MTTYLANDTDITAVANAIRTKGGTSAQLTFPSGFVTAIQNLPSGGGGTYQTITKTYTPSASQQTETITAGSGYDAIQEVDVTVNAVPAGTANYIGCYIEDTLTSLDIEPDGEVRAYYYHNAGDVHPVQTAGWFDTSTVCSSYISVSGSTYLSTIAATTYHPSSTDQTIASGKYTTGAQTIKAVTTTNLTAANIKSGVTVKIGDSTDDDCVTSVTGTYTGEATVQTKETDTLSSTVTSISFTGLSAQPKMWAVQNEVSSGSYFSGASTRYITSCLCSGGSTVYSLAMYKSGSTAREYGYSTCTWSYSNGTLTVTSPGTSTAGGFRTGSKYRLFAAY